MKKKEYDDDDGRVVADMNIDGMPWTNGRYLNRLTIMPRRLNSRKSEPDIPVEGIDTFGGKKQAIDATPKETKAILLNAVLAGLLIAGVFAVAFGLFVLFCTKLWFK